MMICKVLCCSRDKRVSSSVFTLLLWTLRLVLLCIGIQAAVSILVILLDNVM